MLGARSQVLQPTACFIIMFQGKTLVKVRRTRLCWLQVSDGSPSINWLPLMLLLASYGVQISYHIQTRQRPPMHACNWVIKLGTVSPYMSSRQCIKDLNISYMLVLACQFTVANNKLRNTGLGRLRQTVPTAVFPFKLLQFLSCIKSRDNSTRSHVILKSSSIVAL